MLVADQLVLMAESWQAVPRRHPVGRMTKCGGGADGATGREAKATEDSGSVEPRAERIAAPGGGDDGCAPATFYGPRGAGGSFVRRLHVSSSCGMEFLGLDPNWGLRKASLCSSRTYDGSAPWVGPCAPLILELDILMVHAQSNFWRHASRPGSTQFLRHY